MDFLKKIFAKIKTFPKVFKAFSLKNIIDYFKSHRLLAIIYLVVVIAVIFILFLLINYFRNQQTEIAVSKTDEKSATADVQDLSLTIPENAYPYPKSFTINKISRDAA
ncbi:MAG: hypothetical protein U9N62_07005, partial [Thermotogota bacterium]|nr:hypothetical protein [Thermotogota bacterium]